MITLLYFYHIFIMFSSWKTNLDFLFAELYCNRWNFVPSFLHPLTMGHQSFCHIPHIIINIDAIVPQPLSKDGCSDPYLLLVRVPIVELAPHTGLPAYNIHIGVSRTKFVHLSPIDVGTVCCSLPPSKTNIKIGQILIWQNNFILPICKLVKMRSITPPLNHIIFHQR